MKKIFSAAAVSALLLAAATSGFAGSKHAQHKGPQGPGCPEDCQNQIDGLNSSQARQDEQINGLQADQARQDNDINALQTDQARQDEQIMANTNRLDQHDNDINALKNRKHEEFNPWYVKGVARMIWAGSMDVDKAEYGFKADTDTGYGIGLAGGRRIGNFRAETELATQSSDITAEGLDEITIKTLMFNGFYHVPLPAFGIFGAYCDALSVYGMAGLGAGKTEIFFTNGVDESETTFAYKVGMGFAYDIDRHFAVDLGYEYMRTSDIELGADHGLLRMNDIKNSSINAALRYSF